MKIKYLLISLLAIFAISCTSIEPVTKLYQETDIKKVCIFADFQNREVRKEIEQDLAQQFKNTETEAYESYILLPKTTDFSQFEMKNKLKDLKISHYLFIKNIRNVDSLKNTDKPFVEFGILEGPSGTIKSSPQFAAKIIDSDGYPVWSTTIAYDEDITAEFPFKKEKYLKTLINELASSNLINLKTKERK